MAKIGIITGLQFEADILRAEAKRMPHGERPIVVCHGMGRARARAAAEAAAAEGATALLSFGIAAGLDPRLEAGDVIAAATIHDGPATLAGDTAWTARLHEGYKDALRITRGIIVRSDVIIGTALEKTNAFKATGASAADMESYGVAEAAAALNFPFAALRAIADTASDDLPPTAMSAATPDGRISMMKSAFGALTHPGETPALMALGQRTSAARQSLKLLARLGLTRRFFV